MRKLFNGISMNEKIGQIIDVFKSQEDLKNETLTFFSPTLAQLEHILEKKYSTLPIQLKLETDALIDNHIPKSLAKYIALPLLSRTTEIIKDNQTAREILINELQLFKQQTDDLLKRINEEDKSNFLAINRKFNTLHSELQLEREVFQPLELEPINQNWEKEGEKLLSQSVGTWETSFKRPTKEIKKKKGLSPSAFLITASSIIVVLLIIAIIL